MVSFNGFKVFTKITVWYIDLASFLWNTSIQFLIHYIHNALLWISYINRKLIFVDGKIKLTLNLLTNLWTNYKV